MLQFVKFLDDHQIEKPGSEANRSMFEEIEEIHRLYLKTKLEEDRCGKFLKPLSCLRAWNEEKSRLRKLLDLNDDADSKVPVMSVVKNGHASYS